MNHLFFERMVFFKLNKEVNAFMIRKKKAETKNKKQFKKGKHMKNSNFTIKILHIKGA